MGGTDEMKENQTMAWFGTTGGNYRAVLEHNNYCNCEAAWLAKLAEVQQVGRPWAQRDWDVSSAQHSRPQSFLVGWFPLFHLPSPRGQKVEWAQVGAAHTVGCEQQAVQRPGDAALRWERPSNLSPFLLGRDNSLEYLRGGEGEVSSFITLEWLWREISLHQGEEITIFINESALYPGGIHCL